MINVLQFMLVPNGLLLPSCMFNIDLKIPLWPVDCIVYRPKSITGVWGRSPQRKKWGMSYMLKYRIIYSNGFVWHLVSRSENVLKMGGVIIPPDFQNQKISLKMGGIINRSNV